MRLLRSTLWVQQVVSLVLVLLVLNVSIDPPDLLRNLDNDVALEEDISINEMESISEVVLEQVLDLDNAVPETHDEESDTYLKKVEIFQSQYSIHYPTISIDFLPQDLHPVVPLTLRAQTSLSIMSPPPWGIA